MDAWQEAELHIVEESVLFGGYPHAMYSLEGT
jgi:hypothetical protein